MGCLPEGEAVRRESHPGSSIDFGVILVLEGGVDESARGGVEVPHPLVDVLADLERGSSLMHISKEKKLTW
jgi:hypothetical protein